MNSISSVPQFARSKELASERFGCGCGEEGLAAVGGRGGEAGLGCGVNGYRVTRSLS